MSATRALRARTSLPDEIAADLETQIRGRALDAGARLPTEQALAATYGVSRAVVREAIAKLKHDGWVTSRQGSGLFVCALPGATAFRIDRDKLDSAEELTQVFELRAELEAGVAGMAARRRTARQLAAIEEALRAFETALQAGHEGVEEDVAFHRSIAAASGNPHMQRLMDLISPLVGHAIERAYGVYSGKAKGLDKVLAEHRAVAAAIGRGDEAAARRSMRRHIVEAQARLLAVHAERGRR